MPCNPFKDVTGKTIGIACTRGRRKACTSSTFCATEAPRDPWTLRGERAPLRRRQGGLMLRHLWHVLRNRFCDRCDRCWRGLLPREAR